MVEDKIILDFIRSELLVEDIPIDRNSSLFRTQLLDSMKLVELIRFLEDQFALKVRAMDIIYENLDSVQNILDYIERRRKIAHFN